MTRMLEKPRNTRPLAKLNGRTLQEVIDEQDKLQQEATKKLAAEASSMQNSIKLNS